MVVSMFRRLLLSALAVLLTGCFAPKDTTSLQQHTADATAAAKRNVAAIARGVAEGLTRKGPLDLNQATPKQLTALPGITPKLASAIVAGRPYRATNELVRRKILTKDQFNQVKNRILVKRM